MRDFLLLRGLLLRDSTVFPTDLSKIKSGEIQTQNLRWSWLLKPKCQISFINCSLAIEYLTNGDLT